MNFHSLLIGAYALFWAALIVLLIYFVIKRIKAKQAEDFEQRDN